MIRIVTALVIFLVSQVTYTQTKFEQGMQQAFQLMKENKNEEAANAFERIAQVEKDNWLPFYNLALLKARTTFEMKDKTKVAAEIKAAEEFADKADDISPDNSEIYLVVHWGTNRSCHRPLELIDILSCCFVFWENYQVHYQACPVPVSQ
mgnify:CR=1 FL=1